MKLHLNGWQRLGVVIAIIWVIGSFIGFRWQMVHERLAYVDELERACVSHGKTSTECYVANHPLSTLSTPDPAYSWRKGDLTTLLIISFGGVPILWLIGWISIKATRWVRAGFS